jgi:Xaa-Pro dipeptidase
MPSNYRGTKGQKMDTEQLVLSLQERDRRWRRVRTLMKENGVDCLIVAGLKSREQLDGYLTNEYAEGIVIFPMEGAAVSLTWSASRITRRWESSLRGSPLWVEDMRVGIAGPVVVGVLKEKGFDRSKIGVVGLESRSPGEIGGCLPYTTWSHVLNELKQATFVDLSLPFCELVLTKSEEELRFVRISASIGEQACEAMLRFLRPGVTEQALYGEIIKTICERGAGLRYPIMILQTGVDNLSWGPPMWQYQAQPLRVLREGDLVQAEIFPSYGGFETQQQMSVALKPVHPINAELAKIARRSYEIGLRALRPGKLFRDVCEEMEQPISEAGCWHLTPLIHSLNPLGSASATLVGAERVPEIQNLKGIRPRPLNGGDLVIQAGMVFELEPNACRGKHRTNIGGSVIVHEDRVEELNTLPTEMRTAG